MEKMGELHLEPIAGCILVRPSRGERSIPVDLQRATLKRKGFLEFSCICPNRPPTSYWGSHPAPTSESVSCHTVKAKQNQNGAGVKGIYGILVRVFTCYFRP